MVDVDPVPKYYLANRSVCANFDSMKAIDMIRIETPLGAMVAAATYRGICLLEFAESKKLDLELRQLAAAFKVPVVEMDDCEDLRAKSPDRPIENPHLEALRKQISEYFAGTRREFDLPLDSVGTEFQKRVWTGLQQIPYGGTVSYGRQAEMLGCPSAVRAVAGANGRNKISIILPCHRVVGSDGTLTGYGGGIRRKKMLLDLEAGVSLP